MNWQKNFLVQDNLEGIQKRIAVNSGASAYLDRSAGWYQEVLVITVLEVIAKLRHVVGTPVEIQEAEIARRIVSRINIDNRSNVIVSIRVLIHNKINHRVRN